MAARTRSAPVRQLILVGDGGAALHDALARLAASAGDTVAPDLVVHPDTAALQAEPLPEARHLILLYRGCAADLALAMARGQTPSEALDAWLVRARQIAAILRRHRQDASLIETAAAAADPRAAADAVAARAGLEAAAEPAPTFPARATKGRPTKARAAEARAPEADDDHDAGFHRLIAAQLLAQSPAARRLDTELEASALPLAAMSAPPLAADADLAFHAFRRGGAAAQDRIARLEAEIEALHHKVTLPAEEFEALRLEQTALSGALAQKDRALAAALTAAETDRTDTARAHQAEIAALHHDLATARAALAAPEAEVAALHAALAAREAETALLSAQLLELQGDLEAQFLAAREAEDARAAREAEIEALLGSTSWKVTGPLRGVRRILSPGARAGAATEG